MRNTTRTAIDHADRFQRTIDSIHAMNWLVHIAIEQGDGLSFIASGIHTIFEDQCSHLTGIYEHYSELVNDERINPYAKGYRELMEAREPSNTMNAPSKDDHPDMEITDKAGRGEFYSMQLDFVADQLEQGKRIEEIAGAMNLVPAAVRAMVEAMPDKATREALKARERSQTAKVLRKGFIEEKSLEGVDPAAIAQSLNLKRSTVERVIQQLQAGGKAPVEAPDAAEQAEEDVA